MTPDDHENDLPAIRPHGQTGMLLAAAFQATEWSATPDAVAKEQQQSAGAAPPEPLAAVETAAPALLPPAALYRGLRFEARRGTP